jgi:hypothetical protein
MNERTDYCVFRTLYSLWEAVHEMREERHDIKGRTETRDGRPLAMVMVIATPGPARQGWHPVS